MDNPSAFPYVVSEDNMHGEPGMSLRDWFAGQLMGSVIAQMREGNIGYHPIEGCGPAGFAASAYEIADAMMETRKQKEETTNA